VSGVLDGVPWLQPGLRGRWTAAELVGPGDEGEVEVSGECVRTMAEKACVTF
jgi:hypothetical protein